MTVNIELKTGGDHYIISDDIYNSYMDSTSSKDYRNPNFTLNILYLSVLVYSLIDLMDVLYLPFLHVKYKQKYTTR